MKRIVNNMQQLAGLCLSVMLIFFAMSCQEDKIEKVFDKPAIERSRESITALREKLQSSEFGWKTYYKPSKEETGYYQFVFRFLKDSVVEMASDFSAADLTLRKSEYSVLQGSTTKLSFSTFGAIHKLSDSNYSPIPEAEGSGLKGDFEFLYYGQTDEGDLIFRTNRTQDTVIFKQATASSVSDLTLSYNNITKLTESASFFRALQETINGKVINSSFSVSSDTRLIEINSEFESTVNGQTISSLEVYSTGYGLTTTGIFLDSIKLSNGEIVRNVYLSLVEGEHRFATTLAGGTQLSIGDSDSPVPAQKYFLNPALTSNLRFYYKDVDVEPLTTPAFDAIFEKVKPIGVTGVAPEFYLYRQLPFGGGKIDYLNLIGTASVVNANVRQLLIYEDKGDRLVMHRNGFRDANSAVKPANEAVYNEFIDFLTDPEGFYVENKGTYTPYSNLIFTFSSVKDPSIRFALYHFKP